MSYLSNLELDKIDLALDGACAEIANARAILSRQTLPAPVLDSLLNARDLIVHARLMMDPHSPESVKHK